MKKRSWLVFCLLIVGGITSLLATQSKFGLQEARETQVPQKSSEQTMAPAPVDNQAPTEALGSPTTDSTPPNEAELRLQNLVDETRAAIPTKSSLQKMGEAAQHQTPKEMIAAGHALGKISKLLIEEPTLRRQGREFYLSCAKDQTYPDSVRALCLSDFRAIGKDLGDSTEWSKEETDIPDSIRRLADKI